jgi:peptidyl-prolyl cis-trans isomerase C
MPKPKTVSVNGVVVPKAEIAREVQHHAARTPIAAWQAAARALAVRELLLQEARRLEIAAAPAGDAQGRRETEEDALIRALVEREVETPEPDRDTCRRYYEQNRRRFRSGDIYEAAHILFAAPRQDRIAYQRAQTDCTAVIEQVEQSPDRFAELARAHSACPSAAVGGNLGQITADQTTPEFERALSELAPGSVSRAPVATRYGFHIIRLARKHEGRELPFDLVADRIAEYLKESVQRRATAQYIARLASVARLEGIELAGTEALRVN